MDLTDQFEAERPRLVRIAAGVLDDRAEAEDVVQQAWLRLDRTETTIENLPGWLTTVTTRLCLDRLRARTPELLDDLEPGQLVASEDPAEELVLADTVGVALHIVLEQLSPRERVAFVLHDTFGVDFDTVAAVLDSSPVAARKLASRARSKVSLSAPDGPPAAWEVVDAFLAASREGDFSRLLHLLAPDVTVTADAAAIATGTPERLVGRDAVAGMFDGAAKAAFPVFVDAPGAVARPGAAWIHRGQARVVFDFTVRDGVVTGIVFRAAPEVLATVTRRAGAEPA